MKCDLTVTIDGQEALPVRAIPYVTGGEMLQPGELARNFARQQTVAAFQKLANTFAYRLHAGSPIKMLPKEWDVVLRRIDALHKDFETQFDNVNESRGYVEWLDKAVSELPAGVFVWFVEFKKDMPTGKKQLAGERTGDHELVLCPTLTDEQRKLVFAGFEEHRPMKMPLENDPADESGVDSPTGAKKSKGVTNKEVLIVDWPLRTQGFTQKSLTRALSDTPKWLQGARLSVGSPGKAPSTWNPAGIASRLVERKYANAMAMKNFLTKTYPEWVEDWDKSQELT